MACERLTRFVAFGHEASVEFFDADSVGREVGLLVGRAERQYGGVLLVQPDGHLTRGGVLRHALDYEHVATCDDGGADHGQCFPAVDPAVGVENLCE
ncbi:hypothetical protein ACFQ0G_05045 [Streptomyces chiangmaiensis]